MAHTGERRRIRFHAEALPPRVAMDARVIELALQNLLSNALKYSPPHSPVDLELRAGEDGQIEFVVRDYGIGIAEADMAHIWDAFYRGSNVGDAPGTGLGLALVKSCADLHGGSVEVRSRAGQGACFIMSVPDWLRHNAPKTGPAPQAEVITA
jgi:signal transduction histidine kinase